MKLTEFKKTLGSLSKINFQLENGLVVPNHFHVTEVGIIRKDFIDCGGEIRNEKIVNFQLWYSNDFNHRLKPKKLIDIIELSETKFSMENLDIEIEYQSETIGKYNVSFDGKNFILLNKKTNCLAEDQCGIEIKKPKISLSQLQTSNCSPDSDCC
jgi:hypothetical protein